MEDITNSSNIVCIFCLCGRGVDYEVFKWALNVLCNTKYGVPLSSSKPDKVHMHKKSLLGVEEQKVIKSFSMWAFLMPSSSKSASTKNFFPVSPTESFTSTTPLFSGKTKLVLCY